MKLLTSRCLCAAHFPPRVSSAGWAELLRHLPMLTVTRHRRRQLAGSCIQRIELAACLSPRIAFLLPADGSEHCLRAESFFGLLEALAALAREMWCVAFSKASPTHNQEKR